MERILLQLTESDKRVLFALLLVIILLLLLLWYIGYLITRIMKKQSKKIDTAVSDAVTTKVITDAKHFKKYAHKKNWQIFYKAAKIPILIFIGGSIFLLVKEIISSFTYNPFNDVDGFGTILFKFDLSQVEYTNVFFLPFPVFKTWPPIIMPQFKIEAWAGYIFVTCLLVSGVWYLIDASALFARYLRIRKLSDSIFSKNLDNFNIYNSNNTTNSTNNENSSTPSSSESNNNSTIN